MRVRQGDHDIILEAGDRFQVVEKITQKDVIKFLQKKFEPETGEKWMVHDDGDTVVFTSAEEDDFTSLIKSVTRDLSFTFKGDYELDSKNKKGFTVKRDTYRD